jgi:hypothetical protein
MWEFRVLIVEPTQLEPALNALGAKEWELMTAQTFVQAGALVSVCVLRRERL